jgi:hypothetical protein
VTASLASPTMTIGSTDSVTAQTTLTNPNSVPPTTPAAVPVVIQTDPTICTVTPPGSQPSGTTFTLNAIAAGTCTITVQADTSALSGATADTASLIVTIAPSPNPTPTPQSCDLSANGKCYHRIVAETTQQFSKIILPATSCINDANDGVSCSYIDAVGNKSLYGEVWFLPPWPPTPSHELLFRILKISSLTYGCLPYSQFAGVPGWSPIPWPSSGIGVPVDAFIGFGQPSTFARSNYVFTGRPDAGFLGQPMISQDVTTTLAELIAAIADRRIGTDYVFGYSLPGAQMGSYITWYADFPGCDTAGDPNSPGAEYGLVTLGLTFEVYQAQ